MIGKTVSHYTILERLGSGGMGVVYKARDLKLDRFVALKFLPPHLGADAGEKMRFIQEAKAASALDHPNICTIYEIDESEDGQMFIAMAYYEGDTVQGANDKGQARGREQGATGAGQMEMEIEKVIDLAIQVAQGLAAAHRNGIVHRDLKPANVIMTKEGVAKIVDFGLAKLTAKTRITKAGATVGTAAYMSPEQARGEDVDHRTDIWSLGVLLYECLAGQLPFKGEKDAALVYSILVEDPKPISEWRNDTPDGLQRIIVRALAKDADERYQHMGEMLDELKALQHATATQGVEKRRRHAPRFLRKQAHLFVGIAGVFALALAIGLYQWLPQRPAIDSVAVLPFVNVSADPNLDYVAEGASESLIRSLSQLPSLRVISFSAVSRFKGKAANAQEIGRELNVRAVLVGRVVQRGENLSISAELVDTNDNRHIWGEQYDRKLTDLLAVQNEITNALAEKLQPALTDEEKNRLARRHPRNPEAYQLYLKGRYYAGKYTKDGLEKGISYIRQALELDPNFALAYDGLAYCYIAAFEWVMSPKEALPRAKEAALKALELDQSLAEAHASLGAVYFFYEWDWPAAEREFKRAIQLNPKYATTYQHYCQYLVAAGRFDQALAVAKRAQELEALSPETNTYLGWVLSVKGQNDLALAQLNNALEMDPNFWFARLFLAGVYEAKGQLAEACAEYEKASATESEFSEALANLATCYVRQGKTDEARNIMRDLHERAESSYVPPYFFFMIHRDLGEMDKAFPWFEAAYEQHCVYLLWAKVFSYSSFQRLDPRLAAILDKVGVKDE